MALGKHLVQAVPFVYTLQCLTSKVDIIIIIIIMIIIFITIIIMIIIIFIINVITSVY